VLEKEQEGQVQPLSADGQKLEDVHNVVVSRQVFVVQRLDVHGMVKHVLGTRCVLVVFMMHHAAEARAVTVMMTA
jgi:hypothetical protein